MFVPMNHKYHHYRPPNWKLTISGIGYIIAGTTSITIYGLIGFAGMIILFISGEAMEDTVVVADWFALFLGLVKVICIISFFCFIIGFLAFVSGLYIFARRRYSLIIISGILNLLVLSIWVYAFTQDMAQNFSNVSMILSLGFISIFIWQLISIIFIMRTKDEFDILRFPNPPMYNLYQ